MGTTIAISFSVDEASASTPIVVPSLGGLTFTESRHVGLASTNPPARSEHAMAFDAGRGVTVMIGGLDAGGQDLQDVWEWNGARWSQAFSAGGPTARHAHALSYDAARGRLVLNGGLAAGNAQSDTWEWDGTVWTLLQTNTSPGSRSGHTLVYDPDRRRHVLVGGGRAAPEAWELHADPDQRAGASIVVDWAPLAVDAALTTGLSVNLTAGGSGASTVVPGTGAAVPGVDVGIWNYPLGSWSWVGASAGTSSAPVTASAAVSGVAGVQPLVSADQHLHVLVRSTGGMGNATSGAVVSLDSIELRVTYQYPN